MRREVREDHVKEKDGRKMAQQERETSGEGKGEGGQVIQEVLGMVKRVEGMVGEMRGEAKKKKWETKMHDIESAGRRNTEGMELQCNKKVEDMEMKCEREIEQWKGRVKYLEKELAREREDRAKVIEDR